ncbi:MAG: hypothetical protein ABF991_13090 [Liquorilactobacillus hordei]|uniref:hypothetical protein n=1 Tax=Liquorilactobacillus hordei TaxID=468911 RepID=UPI0039EA5775
MDNRQKLTFDWKYALHANLILAFFVFVLNFSTNNTALLLSLIPIVFLLFLRHLFEKKHDTYKLNNRIFYKPISITCLFFFIIGELILAFNYQTSQNLVLLFSYAFSCAFIRDGFSKKKL